MRGRMKYYVQKQFRTTSQKTFGEKKARGECLL